MQLASHTIQFSPLLGGNTGLDEVLGATALAGFDAVGIDIGIIDAYLLSGGTVAGVAAALSSHGLSCTDVVFLPVGADDAVTVALTRRVGALAAAVGAPLCVVGIVASLRRDELDDRVARCATMLTEQGVRMAVEFTPYGELTSPAGARRVCDAVGWDRAGLLLDSLHTFRGGTALADVAALAADEIALVQFSDAAGPPPDDLAAESRHRRLLPGEGDLPLREFVGAIRETGFDGTVAAEVLSDDVRRSDAVGFSKALRAALDDHWPT